MMTLISAATTAVAVNPDAYVGSAVQKKGLYAGAGASTGAPRLVRGRVLFVPNSQAYFWTPEWQAFERQADADITAGRMERFASMDDAIAALRSPE